MSNVAGVHTEVPIAIGLSEVATSQKKQLLLEVTKQSNVNT